MNDSTPWKFISEPTTTNTANYYSTGCWTVSGAPTTLSTNARTFDSPAAPLWWKVVIGVCLLLGLLGAMSSMRFGGK